MDFLIKFLAQVFASFRIKNPVVASAVLFGLGLIVNGTASGEFYGLFTLPAWASEAVRYIGLFVMAVTGSEVWQYLQPKTDKA